MTGVRVEDATTTYERITGKILIDDLRPSWLIFSDGFRVSRWTRIMKRSIDLTLAAALAIVVVSGHGADGASRSGSSRAARSSTARSASARTGGCSRSASSARCGTDAERAGRRSGRRTATTASRAVGRFIRKTRLDELPQLWNVRARRHELRRAAAGAALLRRASWRGEIPFYQQRHAVKPGITGWAQVKYRYGSSVEDAMEKLRYDLYYIKHLSIVFDLTIVFDTVKVVLFRKGAA